MGKLKEEASKSAEIEFTVGDSELQKLQNINQAAALMYNLGRTLLAEYLKVMYGVTRWPFDENANLTYEVDPATKTIRVKLDK